LRSDECKIAHTLIRLMESRRRLVSRLNLNLRERLIELCSLVNAKLSSL